VAFGATPGDPAAGGIAVRDTKGFTLIELLIVVVIIGILASIAIPKYQNIREKAWVAGMKSDLRNLVTAQEAYFADNVTYASTTTNLNIIASSGNTMAITGSSGTGWSATISSPQTAKTCGVFVGNGTPPISGEVEGAPTCQ
jgi:type IV pilus assembly protein PilA